MINLDTTTGCIDLYREVMAMKYQVGRKRLNHMVIRSKDPRLDLSEPREE
jgi:hypothetical protein